MKTILKNGQLFTAESTQPLANGSLVIEDDKITALGPAATIADDPAATVIDCTGKTILPGLFNCHAHLAWDGIHDLEAQSRYDDEAIQAFKCAMNMQKALSAGVTTLRDLGMHLSNVKAKEAIKRGIVTGPRLLITGAAICATGGHTWWCCVEADGPDNCRQAVREQLKLGTDLIKVMGSGATPEFTMDELAAMVDEAHMARKKITAHATFNEAIKRVAKAGVDSVEHGGSMDDETIQLLLDRNIFVVTTFSPLFLQAEHGHEVGMSPAAIQARKAQCADVSRFDGLIRAARAGVKMALGTDAGSPAVPHDDVATEMRIMMDKGLVNSYAEAIINATARAAELCGILDNTGTLAVGKLADVIVVNGDPLKDIEVIRCPSYVFLEGKRVVG